MKLLREIQLNLESAVTVSLLSGHRQIGGTKLHIQEGNNGILVDFGLNFSLYGKYFGDFNKIRTCHGIHDPWQMGILPPVEGLYRSDLQPMGMGLQGEVLPVDACLISHPHMDHWFGAGALREDLPFHMSALCAAMLKSTQDIGQSDFMGEVAYAVPKVNSSADPRAICSAATSSAANARPLAVVHGELTSELQQIWNGTKNSSPRARQMNPNIVSVNTERAGNFKVEAWPVDHSTLGCLGFIVYTSAGPVAYTGDLRRHGKLGYLTDRFIERLKAIKPKVLVAEHTRIGRPMAVNTTEGDVRERAIAIAKAHVGAPIICDFGGRHVERLLSFLDVAYATARQLVVSTKDAHLLETIGKVDPDWNVLNSRQILIYDEVKASPNVWERELKTRHQSRLITAPEVKAARGDLLLCLSLWDLTETLSFEPEGLQYIYSSSEPHGELDAVADLWRLNNWVSRCNGELHGFRWEGVGQNGQPIFDDLALNASGHISEEDLEWLVKEVQPEILIPCHGEHPEWFAEILKDEPIKVVLGD
ncbi:MAG TPA: MBL fold metallo-hydrolase RNA specificity domain-containing protein [Fimbriimonadaceae bacterium]|jgi:ribonuclease J